MRKTIAVLLLTGAVAGGCARVMVNRHDVSPGAQDEQRGYHARGMHLEDGTTTRADVERLLGLPELVRDEGRVAAYRWQRLRYEKHLPDYLNREPEHGVPAAVMYSSLVLRFDDGGVLRGHRKFRHRVEYGAPPTLPELVSAWQDDVAVAR
jgi:hypothetical protein